MARTKLLREVFLVGIYLLGILGITASGGGGGGGDGDDDELIIKALYEFQIGGPLEDSADSVIGLDRQDEFSFSTEPDLQGDLICDQNTEECELQTIAAGSSIAITDLTMPTFVGNINILVENNWLYNPSVSDRPVTGSVRISGTGGSDIIVEVTDCDAGSIGNEVQVSTDPPSPPSDCYLWDDFEDLVGDPASTLLEQQASLGWGAVAFITELGLTTLQVFPYIADDVFAGNNSYSEACDIYSATWAGGPPNPGDFTLDWLDDTADSQVGPGDSFRQTFNDCWAGDSGDGELLNGSIDYIGYTQVIQNQLITRIGFENAAPGSGKIGGVAFNSLVLTETSENNNVITTDTPMTFTGKYLIAFF